MRYGTELEADLSHERLVVLGSELDSRGMNIDQATNDARLGVGDPHRLVRAHEQHGVDPSTNMTACTSRSSSSLHAR